MRQIALEDLPRHSEWAGYLLDRTGDPPGDPTAYTRVETYESLYGHILEAWRSSSATVPEFVRSVRAHGRTEPDAISIEEQLYLASTIELLERERTVVREALEPLASDAATIVDLGCGWGATLGTIADSFPGVDVVGGELAENGVHVARELYADRDRISVEQFDFHGGWALLTNLERSVVFTKGALTTNTEVDSIIERFGRLTREGNVVGGVHLEPVDMHPETPLGKLRRRYAQERGYNGELLRLLERDDRLVATEICYDVVGANPLHPLSTIRWRTD